MHNKIIRLLYCLCMSASTFNFIYMLDCCPCVDRHACNCHFFHFEQQTTTPSVFDVKQNFHDTKLLQAIQYTTKYSIFMKSTACEFRVFISRRWTKKNSTAGMLKAKKIDVCGSVFIAPLIWLDITFYCARLPKCNWRQTNQTRNPSDKRSKTKQQLTAAMRTRLWTHSKIINLSTMCMDESIYNKKIRYLVWGARSLLG